MFEHGRVNWAEVLDAARSGAEMGAAGFLAARAFYSACFAGDMLVLTRERGAVRWDQLREGEEVWSQDEFDPNAAGAWKRVEEIFRTEAFIWKLRVAGQEIKTTDEHPFWVVGKGWTAAKELRPGDRLRGHDGERYPVESIEPTDEFVAVYNARIAEYHTYFVQAPGGGAWLWAHNAYKADVAKVRDFQIYGRTKLRFADFNTEGHARAIARRFLGKHPVKVAPGKWRSPDGKWQYRAKPNDIAKGHVHLERLDPRTGFVKENWHLRFPRLGGRP